MSERDDGPARPPDLPITSSDYDPPSPRFGRPEIGGWKIATGILAITTVVALVWGVTTTNNLQSQVDTLQTAIKQQERAGRVDIRATRAKTDALNGQVAVLSDALKVLKKQAGDALEGAEEEKKTLKKQLAKTEDAIQELRKELKKSDSDSASIAVAYEDAQAELVATQEAMADLLAAVAEQTRDSPDEPVEDASSGQAEDGSAESIGDVSGDQTEDTSGF